MTCAIDTNVLLALWKSDDELNTRARNALYDLSNKGQLVISGAVFVELAAGQERTIELVERFLYDTSISIDWSVDEAIWRMSAIAFREYVTRRRKQGRPEPRRIATDFLIGAHAAQNRYQLLTFDERIFKSAFPQLKILNG